MQDSMYSALFGALSNEHRLNVIANNLANVNTTGYKQDQVTFADTFLRFAHDYILDSKPFLRADPLWPEPSVLAKPRLADQYTDQTQGALRVTGNPLDLALQGDGFFRVQNPQTGELFLTRNGNFGLDADGQIVDGSGNLLMAGGGPITVPPSATVLIDHAGNVLAGEQGLGQIDVVTVPNPARLEKVGNNLFRTPEGEAEEIAAGLAVAAEGAEQMIVRATVNQGYLEASNVEVVTEMVRMISANRSFEAYSKIMQGSDTIDKRIIAVASKA